MTRNKLKRLAEVFDFVQAVRMTSMPDERKAQAYAAAARMLRGIS